MIIISISVRNLADFFQEIKQELIRLGKICDLDLFVIKLISKQQLQTQQKGENMNFYVNFFENLEITP